MEYIATISFSGLITMAKGQKREITDSALVSDLTKAGYIIPYKSTAKVETKDDKPKNKRKGKAE